MFKSQFWNKKVDKNLINIREPRTKQVWRMPRSLSPAQPWTWLSLDVKFHFVSDLDFLDGEDVSHLWDYFLLLGPKSFQSEVEVSNLLITIFGENYQFFITMNFLPA